MLTVNKIWLAQSHLGDVKCAVSREVMRQALQQLERHISAPVIFRFADGGNWLVGVGDDVRVVHGNLRGLLPAWAALSRGQVPLVPVFVAEDERGGTRAAMRSIRDQCAAWAESEAQCPRLAAAFRQIHESSGLAIYSGKERVITA